MWVRVDGEGRGGPGHGHGHGHGLGRGWGRGGVTSAVSRHGARGRTPGGGGRAGRGVAGVIRCGACSCSCSLFPGQGKGRAGQCE